MSETAPNPNIPAETTSRGPVWKRGGVALLLMIAVEIAQTLLWAIAILQFGWMMVMSEKNSFISNFGLSLSEWQRQTTRFVTGATDDRPFPWAEWPKSGD